MTPFFSVVLPTHDRLPTLRRAVASVLEQELVALELIVVDDGSRDGTTEWLEQQVDPRLRWLRQENRGVCAARNRGAAQARGQYITFLDSDDEALPGWLETLAALDTPSAGLLTCGLVERYPGETDSADRIVPPLPCGAELGDYAVNFIPGTFAVRRDLFAAVGGYVEQLRYSENTELLMRLTLLCRSKGLSVESTAEPLIVYYRHPRPHTRRRLEDQLAASEWILEHHGHGLHPVLLAERSATAGVRAAKLGRWPRARFHFRNALRRHPRWRYAARWLIVRLPGLRRAVWSPARAE